MFSDLAITIGPYAPIASAVASTITMIIGVLVFREARSIRRADWRSKNNERWTNFNDLVLKYDYAERWGKIIHGKVEWADITQKDKMVIYSFLNVLSHQYNLAKIHLMPWRYVRKSVGDNIMYFDHFWSDLVAHLRHDGWSPSFVQLLDDHVMECRRQRETPPTLPRRRFLGLGS